MGTIEESVPIRCQRRHSAEFKAKAVQECMQPGVSIAAIALYHRLNASLLWCWVAEQKAKNSTPEDRELMRMPQGELILLRIGEPTTTVPDTQIGVRHDVTTISLRQPESAVAQCVQWLQGWLR